jgi:zinc/manganese transport system substrate-binding protein
VPLALIAILAVLVAGCGSSDSARTTGSAGEKLNVVAAEDFWGSIAEQLGGEKVEVTELVVGDVVGLKDGDNPHQWYSPISVGKVIDAITADYKQALPGNDSYFDQERKSFETKGLAEYNSLISQIKAAYAGTPVGASESIFEPLAPSLGLKLITPLGFMDGIAEGTEPTPADKATADEQIKDNQIKLWVYNSQNATPDVKRLNEEAESAGIPIATVTETLTPEGASFQDWMVAELKGIKAALAEGAGG